MCAVQLQTAAAAEIQQRHRVTATADADDPAFPCQLFETIQIFHERIIVQGPELRNLFNRIAHTLTQSSQKGKKKGRKFQRFPA